MPLVSSCWSCSAYAEQVAELACEERRFVSRQRQPREARETFDIRGGELFGHDES